MPEIDQHIVCYSGGHSSALVACEVVNRYGNENVVLLNHDINPRVEEEDIKRFKREVAEALGLEVTYANHPKWRVWDQFDVCEDAQAFQVQRGQALCTHRLKTEPFMRWLAANVPDKSRAVIYYGFDANERVRIQRRSSIMAAQGYRTDYPLAFWPRVYGSTRDIGVEPPLGYSVWKHANCIGCLKAKKQHWYAVYVTRPDIWERAKQAEEVIGHSIQPNLFLEELEDEFAKMKAAGIPATEHVPPQRFWATARRVVKSLPVCMVDPDEEAKPCECMT